MGTTGVTRRAVVKGAAWSLPIVAVAAATPLTAASGNPTVCDPSTNPTTYPGVVDWTNIARVTSGPDAYKLAAGSIASASPLGAIGLTVSVVPPSSGAGTANPAAIMDHNLRPWGHGQMYDGNWIPYTNNFLTGSWTALDLQMEKARYRDGEAVTFTFDRPVMNFSFWVGGVNGKPTSRFADAISIDAVDGAPAVAGTDFTRNTIAGTFTGAGTSADPVRPPSSSVINDEGECIIAFTVKGPLSSFTLSFRNWFNVTGSNFPGNQMVSIINGSFTSC